MSFRLHPSVFSKSTLAMGDTVAVVYSSSLQKQLLKLRGDLLTARADLVAKRAGEKQSLIDEARKRTEYSRAKIEEKKVLFGRSGELFKRGYVSQAEYDAARWGLRHAEIEHEIDQAQLKVLLSGSKAEDLRVLETVIGAYTNEIALVEKRLRDLVIQSPVGGDINRRFSEDTLLIVNNASVIILSTPIRFEKVHHLAEGSPLRIRVANVGDELTGTLFAISKEVETINGVQVLTVRIILDSNVVGLVPGLLIPGEINLPKVSVIEYLASLFEN